MNMEMGSSGVPFSYTTVIATKSRIEKGLLAIPVSLLNFFPRTAGSVYLLGESGQWVKKKFTAYESRSRECRIGGMREFYERYDVKDGDELVLHVYGNDRYQILPEGLFRRKVNDLEAELDEAPTQAEADAAIEGLAALTRAKADDIMAGEYLRLANADSVERKTSTRNAVGAREHIPPALRQILTHFYHGQCQVSGFSFLKRDGEPYFEVHHIDALQGNHVKNVLVVSPNVHAQFTHAEVEHAVDEAGWLRRVKFNGEGHEVFQIVDRLPVAYKKEIHSV
jgi:hypothetical protein